MLRGICALLMTLALLSASCTSEIANENGNESAMNYNRSGENLGANSPMDQKGWSLNGLLEIGSPKTIGMQAVFAEKGNYTVQFSLQPDAAQDPATVSPIQATAIISWS